MLSGWEDQKFIPRIHTREWKKLAGVLAYTADIYDSIRESLYSKRPSSLGFPSEVAQSAYYPGELRITQSEVELISGILESEGVYLENMRIEKSSRNGKTLYRVLQASTKIDSGDSHRQINVAGSSKKIIITQGDHAEVLSLVSRCLGRAREHAANSTQEAVVDEYLRSFETGEIEPFKESQRLWVKDIQPAVEIAFGSVEPYRDAHGTRAEFEGIVAFVNTDETKVLTKIVEKSAGYIRKLPWTESTEQNDGKGPFEKELLEPPDFTSLQSMDTPLDLKHPSITILEFY